jgi:hypothetical protein
MLGVFLLVDFSLTIALLFVLGFVGCVEGHRRGVRVIDRVNSVRRGLVSTVLAK